MFFLSTMSFEESYELEPLLQNTHMDDEVENCLHMLAATGIVDDGNASDYELSTEDTLSEGEMAAQKNL